LVRAPCIRSRNDDSKEQNNHGCCCISHGNIPLITRGRYAFITEQFSKREGLSTKKQILLLISLAVAAHLTLRPGKHKGRQEPMAKNGGKQHPCEMGKNLERKRM
jgi:hypothetical protein